MNKILTPARLVAATTIMGGLAAFITGIVGVLPEGWQNMALAGAGLLTKAITAVKFLHGNSAWELSPAGQVANMPKSAPLAVITSTLPDAPPEPSISIPPEPLPPPGLTAPIADAPVPGV